MEKSRACFSRALFRARLAACKLCACLLFCCFFLGFQVFALAFWQLSFKLSSIARSRCSSCFFVFGCVLTQFLFFEAKKNKSTSSNASSSAACAASASLTSTMGPIRCTRSASWGARACFLPRSCRRTCSESRGGLPPDGCNINLVFLILLGGRRTCTALSVLWFQLCIFNAVLVEVQRCGGGLCSVLCVADNQIAR